MKRSLLDSLLKLPYYIKTDGTKMLGVKPLQKEEEEDIKNFLEEKTPLLEKLSIIERLETIVKNNSTVHIFDSNEYNSKEYDLE
jgi:hypothetical protein